MSIFSTYKLYLVHEGGKNVQNSVHPHVKWMTSLANHLSMHREERSIERESCKFYLERFCHSPKSGFQLLAAAKEHDV